MTNTYISQEQSTFSDAARRFYNRNKDDQSGFEFFSHFDIDHAQLPRYKAHLRLIISATIEVEDEAYKNISYCLVVGRLRAKRPCAILRKFHFDVTPTGVRRQQHPVCHLQYCGEMIPGMEELGFRDAQLQQMHPSLSEPRIFFWPMSLALLVDMALHEFPDTYSVRFRGTPEWRAIIRNDENLLLRPFYENCVKVITDTRKRTLADEFYLSD